MDRIDKDKLDNILDSVPEENATEEQLIVKTMILARRISSVIQENIKNKLRGKHDVVNVVREYCESKDEFKGEKNPLNEFGDPDDADLIDIYLKVVSLKEEDGKVRERKSQAERKIANLLSKGDFIEGFKKERSKEVNYSFDLITRQMDVASHLLISQFVDKLLSMEETELIFDMNVYKEGVIKIVSDYLSRVNHFLKLISDYKINSASR